VIDVAFAAGYAAYVWGLVPLDTPTTAPVPESM
jgi:hypothetical protein